jgi:phage shock protein C
MKRLYRSRTNRILGGNAAGSEPTSTPIPTLYGSSGWHSILSVGVGVIAYIVAWILIPEEPEVQDAAYTVY